MDLSPEDEEMITRLKQKLNRLNQQFEKTTAIVQLSVDDLDRLFTILDEALRSSK